MRRSLKSVSTPAMLVLLALLTAACGGGGDGGAGGGANGPNGGGSGGSNSGGGGSGGNSGTGGGGGAPASPSNKARFTFDCDLQGLTGKMTMDVELIGNADVVFGPGPNPDITAVIGTGGVTILTSGELVSPTAAYIFTGENQFADFTETTGTFERFRVEWVARDDGLTMIVNPFGPGPTQHDCILTGSSFL